jgi:hypothetical protein
MTAQGEAIPTVGAARRDGRHFVHVACALWLPDVDFAQPDSMSGVQLTRLSRESADLECGACRQVARCSLVVSCKSSRAFVIDELPNSSPTAC